MIAPITKQTLVFCLSFLAILTGCAEKSTYYKLTDADMSWLHYDNNQTVYFQSPNGDVIQYDVVFRAKAYTIEGNTYSEFTGADISQVDDTTIVFAGDNKGLLLIEKVEESTLVTMSWPHFAIKKAPLNTLPLTLANIGGLNFGDVIELDGSLLTDNRNYIAKIWVSKSQGVLQMEDSSGVLWIRSF